MGSIPYAIIFCYNTLMNTPVALEYGVLTALIAEGTTLTESEFNELFPHATNQFDFLKTILTGGFVWKEHLTSLLNIFESEHFFSSMSAIRPTLHQLVHTHAHTLTREDLLSFGSTIRTYFFNHHIDIWAPLFSDNLQDNFFDYYRFLQNVIPEYHALQTLKTQYPGTFYSLYNVHGLKTSFMTEWVEHATLSDLITYLSPAAINKLTLDDMIAIPLATMNDVVCFHVLVGSLPIKREHLIRRFLQQARPHDQTPIEWARHLSVVVDQDSAREFLQQYWKKSPALRYSNQFDTLTVLKDIHGWEAFTLMKSPDLATEETTLYHL